MTVLVLFIATMALSLWAAARVITSLVYFLWHLLPLLGGRSDERA